jgi:hypothetical protein
LKVFAPLTVPDAAGHLSLAEYTLTPIPDGSSGPDDGPMVQLAIRCHPLVPVSADELERWLEEQMGDLRAEAPLGIMRLSRLSQGPPSSNCDIGWLVELELAADEPLLAGDRLGDALRDMRLLGLQPTLLAPTSPPAGLPDGSARSAQANGLGS